MTEKITSTVADTQKSTPQVIEKNSQHAQQDFSYCHAEKTPQTQLQDTSSLNSDVTFISNKGTECHAAEKTHSHASKNEYITDCETLTKTHLRVRYPAEATAHRNMLARAKSRGAVIHSSFYSFKDFLKQVGPVPAKGATLDRINNNDPEYAPGKVRWADKRTQNNNKGDTLVFYCTKTGKTYTSSCLAKLQGVVAATIRQRHARGWSDDEIIIGKKLKLGKKGFLESNVFSFTATNENHVAKPYAKSELTLREKRYQQMAKEFHRHREETGEEALPAVLDVLNEMVPIGEERITEEQYERRFIREFWPVMRPHVDFFNAHPFHQKLIEKIDPEYVSKVRERKRVADEMKENNL